MKVLCTMGYFDSSGEGCLVEVDLAAGTARTLLRYVPPEPLRASAKGFTGACWEGAPGRSTLWVCGHAALFQVAPSPLAVQEIWHQPCMNDLHHVTVSMGRVYLVNTGLEALDVFSVQGSFLGSHALHPGWLSAARQAGPQRSRDELLRARDPRWPATPALQTEPGNPEPGYYDRIAGQPFCQSKVRDLIHPNHVAVADGQLLVTRFLDRSVQEMMSFSMVIEDTPGLPHDGVLDGDVFWLTCANGLVVGYAVEGGRVTGRRVRQLDLFASTGHTGWCRGLLVTPDHFVVGLSEIYRMPRYRWCDRPYEGTETAVLCVDRRTGALLSRVDLTDRLRHSKLFSILPGVPD